MKQRKKKRFKRWLLKRRVNRAAALLVQINEGMIAMNMPRWLRKRLWKKFVNSPEGRLDIINVLKGGTA